MEMLIFGAVGAIVTIGLYGLLRVSWPRLYYGPDDTFEAFISASLWSYLAFRTIPVAVTVGSLGAYATRISDSNIWLLAISFLFTYPLVTSLLTVMGRRRSGRTTSRLDANWIAVSSTIVTAGAAAGVLIAPILNEALPPGEALVEAIITALFVAVLAVLIRAMQLDKVQFDGVIDRTLKRLGPELAEVEKQCIQMHIPAEPFMAILIAESLQRPRWFRRFEFAASKLGASKTVGPFQLPVAGETRRGTPDAIDMSTYLLHHPAIALIAERNAPRRSSEQSERFSAIYSLHNASSKFVNLCDRIAHRFRPKQLTQYVLLETAGVALHFSKLMVSSGNVTAWLAPARYGEHGVVTIIPPDSAPLHWDTDEGDPVCHSAAASNFYKEWTIQHTPKNSSDMRSETFHIQDHAATEPRWS